MRLLRFAVPALAMSGTCVNAQVTTTFGYDARGRVVQAQSTGGVNASSTYQYDRADNRARVIVSAPGSAASSSSNADREVRPAQ